MSFEQFHLHPDLMKGIRDMGYEVPTPIQEQAIPPILEGKDIIGNAQTGTGKTGAFVIPLIHRMIQKEPGQTRVLVLCPTRELAVQIDENVLGLSYHTKVKTASVYGGVKMELQERALIAGSTFIIATPGRLLDHYKYGNWRFDSLEVLVLDEADRMLDMGFMPDIQAIIAKLPPKRQTLLFSATMPEPIAKLARAMMREPVHIKVGHVTPPSSISQCFYMVDAPSKERLLTHLLKQKHLTSVIVFVQTKIGADRLYHRMQRAGFKVGLIHGGREQEERDRVLNAFKGDQLQVLVATDVAARGIDIDGVSHVINFEVPWDPDTYVHRIGRTARAAAIGDAFTFLMPGEEDRAREIEKHIGKEIPRNVEPGFEPDPNAVVPSHDRHGRGRGSHGPNTGRGGSSHRPQGGHGGPHRRSRR